MKGTPDKIYIASNERNYAEPNECEFNIVSEFPITGGIIYREYIGVSVVNTLLEKLKEVCGKRAMRYVQKQIDIIKQHKPYIEMETNEHKSHKLLKRYDSRFLYTMDELQTIIHEEEEKCMKKFNKEKNCIQLWVKNLNINLITDAQIEQIKNEYLDNGWSNVRVMRQTSRGTSCLYIQLEFGNVEVQEV